MAYVQIRCNQCKMPVGSRKGARKHGEETGHNWQPAFQCLDCHQTFNRRKQFKQHFPPPPRPAPVVLAAVPSHVTSNTMEEGLVNVPETHTLHTCGTCNFVFMDETLFINHQQTCGKNTSPGAEGAPAPSTAPSDPTMPTYYVLPRQHSTIGQTSKAHHICHQCGQKFGGKKGIRKHGTESGHQWQPSVRCSACLKAFHTRIEFRAHVPQVSCLDAPMIRLLRSKPTVGVSLAFEEPTHAQSTENHSGPGGTGSANANHKTSHHACTTCGTVFADMPALSEHRQTCDRDNSIPQATAEPVSEPDPVPQSEAQLGLQAGSVLEAVVTSLCTAFSAVGSVSYTVKTTGESGTNPDGDEDDTRPSSPEADSIISQPLTGSTIQQSTSRSLSPVNVPPVSRGTLSTVTKAEGVPVAAPNSFHSSPQSTATAKRVSWHCRICLRDPCAEPAITACGHLFCQKCIVQEIDVKGVCPVCKKVILVKLDVAV
ncbi:hypothetical protein GY45DRAFT_459775 [Cubamyces sp. BRFM 1775]|nr:hypothetical protein GY45DRAFT_459775 [Cubamyces sp. BRFM 1775]